jgi:hypothetical protein
MANFIYNEAKRAFAAGEINLVSNDIRVMLIMTNTTADTQRDPNTISGFTTLDECDGSNYSRITLSGKSLFENATNNRAEFKASNVIFTSLGIGTRQVQAALVYKHVTNDSDSVPLVFFDTNGFPFNGDGTNKTIQWNSTGIIQFS